MNARIRKQLIEFCLGFRDGILDGEPSSKMCFVISAPLETLISLEFEIECVMVRGRVILPKDTKKTWREHYWLYLPQDDIILDCTADQFKGPDGKRMPKVYLGAKPDWYLSEGEKYVSN